MKKISKSNMFQKPNVYKLEAYVNNIIGYFKDRYSLDKIYATFVKTSECFTNGFRIVLGTDFYMFKKERDKNRVIALINGVAFHEVGHILYTPFKKHETMQAAIRRNPEKYFDNEEIIKCFKSSAKLERFMLLFHDFFNRIEDGRIERLLLTCLQQHAGLIAGLKAVRKTQYVEFNVNEYERSGNAYKDMQILSNCILHISKYGVIKEEFPMKDEIEPLIPFIKKMVYETDTDKLYETFITFLEMLFEPFIKPYLDYTFTGSEGIPGMSGMSGTMQDGGVPMPTMSSREAKEVERKTKEAKDDTEGCYDGKIRIADEKPSEDKAKKAGEGSSEKKEDSKDETSEKTKGKPDDEKSSEDASEEVATGNENSDDDTSDGAGAGNEDSIDESGESDSDDGADSEKSDESDEEDSSKSDDKEGNSGDDSVKDESGDEGEKTSDENEEVSDKEDVSSKSEEASDTDKSDEAEEGTDTSEEMTGDDKSTPESEGDSDESDFDETGEDEFDSGFDEDEEEKVKDFLSDVEKMRPKEEADDEESERLKELAEDMDFGDANPYPVDVIPPNRLNNEADANYALLFKDEIEIGKKTAKKIKPLFDPEMKRVFERNQFAGHKYRANRAFNPNLRHFDRRVTRPGIPSLSVAILVDESGSMAFGGNIEAAKKAAVALFEACSELEIPFCTIGHTESYRSPYSLELRVYCNFGENDDKARQRLVQLSARENNRDGAALRYAANLLKTQQTDKHLLIIISDGIPAAHNYDGTKAEKDMQNVIREYERQNVTFVAAAIDGQKRKIEEIYGAQRFLDISNLESLPTVLSTVLRRHILERSF